MRARFIFLPESLENFRPTELYGAPLEGSTIFLYRSSTSRTPLYTSGLAELKHAFFGRTGRNNKKLQRSNLFQLTIFKHGLLKGSTILLQYSSISCTPLESSQLDELKYAIFSRTGRLKNCGTWTSFYWWSLSMGSLRDRHFYFKTAP